MTKDASRSFGEPVKVRRPLLNSVQRKLKFLPNVSQGGRIIPGHSWTVTETVKSDSGCVHEYRESEPCRVYQLPNKKEKSW